MPHKVALTPDQWLAKLLAVLPPWFDGEGDASTLRSHLKGAAAMFSAIEQDAYDHLDETFIDRAAIDTLDAIAAERLIPELGYSGESRRRQIKQMFNRLNRAQIEQIVNDLLPAIPCELRLGVTEDDSTIIPLDYNDDDEQVVSWDEQTQVFNIIIEPQVSTSFTYVDRDCFCDFSYAGYTTVSVAEAIKRAVDFYKVSGVRYRISQKD